MITDENDQFLTTFSISVYRFMLAAYPKEFRLEYGEDMLQVFRDCLLRAYGQNGSSGVFRLWAVTLFDLVISVIEEHLQKETKIMNKNTLIRLSGWALILASIGFTSIFLFYFLDENYPLMHIGRTFYSDFAYVYGFIFSPFLLAFGMLGLKTKYGKRVGSIGKSILLFGSLLGSALTLFGIINPTAVDYFELIFYGFILSMLCLAVFGILAIQHKPLPRWNGLPLLAGIFLPVLIGIGAIVNSLNLEIDFPTILFTLVFFQCLAMLLLGVILQGDTKEQKTQTAAT